MPISPLSDVSGRYGAPMGRQDSDKLDSAIRAFREAEFRMNAIRSSYAPDEIREDLADIAESTAEWRAALANLNAIRAGRDLPLKFYLQRMRLDSGGYDSGGAYWGIGAPLYRYESDNGETAGYLRAATRDKAKAAICADYPAARFYR